MYIVPLICCIAAAPQIAAVMGAVDRPNIVVILADDLGWGDVGFHGSRNKTPHLDRLAAAGVELTQQYVCPMCSPTRAALLTGRYASRFGVTAAQNEQALPWGTPTLASVLHDAGYDTALTGKWHLGSAPSQEPRKFGFDHSYGSLAGGCGPLDHRYKLGPHTRTWHRNGALLEETGHVTDLIAQEAIGWLRSPERRRRPFFLYVPFTAVHIPIDEPRRWLEMYPETMEPSRRQHAACTTHLDDAVGQIEATLVAAGLRENTLLLFLSDNGAPPNARNDDAKYPNGDRYAPGPAGGSNAPLRGQKTQLYEGGIRVPAFVQWPKARWTARQCNQPMHAVDWMPTLCALTGSQPRKNAQWDGMAVAAQIAGQAPALPRTLYWAGVGFRSAAVRVGDWKLIVTKSSGGQPAERVELFDLARDPNETKNLAEQSAAAVARLRQELERAAALDRR